MHYYAWRASTVECDNCKWVGLGAAMTSGESFGDGVDKHCKICGSRYGFIRYPMSHEMKRLEGGPPLWNLAAMAAQAQRGGGGGSNTWQSRITGGSGFSDGTTGAVFLPGGGIVSTGR